MNRKTTALLLAVLLALPACAGRIFDTAYDYDRATDFSRLRTYDWVPMVKDRGKAARVDELTTKRIQKAVDIQLAAKGFIADTDSPDFLVETIYGAKTNRGRATMSGRGYNYSVGWLSLDFVDVSTDRLVWHGSTKADIDPKHTPEKAEALIRDVVAEILAQFPPPR